MYRNIKIAGLFTLIMICYASISLNYIGRQGLWHDEIHTLTVIKGITAYDFPGGELNKFTEPVNINHFRNILTSGKAREGFYLSLMHEGHPPLYFSVLRIWATYAGYTAESLRSFSLLCGVTAFFFLFLTLKPYVNLDWRIFSLGVALVLNPFLYHYFNEARMYAMAFLLAVVMFKFWVLSILQEGKSVYPLIGFVVFAIALMYTHYFGVIFIFSIWAYTYFKKRKMENVLVYAIPIVAYIPWCYFIFKQSSL